MWHTGLTTRRVLASAVKKIDSVSRLLIHAGGWGWEWQMTNYTTMCKKRKGRKSVTSKFVRFEGVKLFALFAVIKFRRGSKTAINYGCKRIGFQRGAAADMSFFYWGGGWTLLKNSTQIIWVAKEGQWKTNWRGHCAAAPCCYPPSLCVGCSASSLPEGWFPNHINEGAMLRPALPRRRLYSRAALFTLYLY